jgi:hypothetical protein
MSKKSRKRNKKILAAIGLGLGAAAMASKRKKDANVEMDLPKADMSKSVPTGPKELGISTAKKDTAVKTKTTIQDNKPKDTTPAKVRMTSANVQSGKIDAPYKNIFSFDGGAKVRSQNAERNARIRKQNNPDVTGTTLPGQSLRSGGRAGLRSGGKAIKKSMGKALRGGGKVMR